VKKTTRDKLGLNNKIKKNSNLYKISVIKLKKQNTDQIKWMVSKKREGTRGEKELIAPE
jgi:hypothetical protein